MLPHLTRRAPWFVFLGHFRGTDDLYRFSAGSLVRRYSRDEAEFRTKMCSLPPLVVAEFLFGFNPIRGELIGIMRMPEEMMESSATHAIVEGLQLAVRRGARVIGLGALTSPVTGGGMTLLQHIPPTVTLTNGNAYTAAVVRHNVIEAATDLGLGWSARVAIVGCTGSVGVPSSHLLAQDGFNLILIGRDLQRVQRELGDLADQAIFASELSAVSDADVIVLLTSHPTALLSPAQVRAGSVVIDCAQPANVPSSTYQVFGEQGVIVVEGALVHIPEYSCTFDFGLPGHGETFACLAETYLFACEGIREHSVGRPSVGFARRLDRLAERRGVCPVSLGLAAHRASMISTRALLGHMAMVSA